MESHFELIIYFVLVSNLCLVVFLLHYVYLTRLEIIELRQQAEKQNLILQNTLHFVLSSDRPNLSHSAVFDFELGENLDLDHLSFGQRLRLAKERAQNDTPWR